MGTVFKRNGRYYIDYRYKGNRIKRMIGPYREMAENELREIETAIYKGTYSDRQKEKTELLFESFADEYYRLHVLQRNKNPKHQKRRLDGLVKVFGRYFLSDITNAMLLEYRGKRLHTVSPSTVNKELALVKSMYSRAIAWGRYAGIDPTRAVQKLRENNESDVYLTEDQTNTLISCCIGMTRAMVIVAVNTGLRWSELRLLCWGPRGKSNYVDIERGQIYIDAALSKSGKPRYIPINHAVRDVMRGMPRYLSTEYIFINDKTGQPFTTKNRAFNRAIKKAGLSGITWHSLRHLFGIRLAEKRVPLYEIQTLMGHSTPLMTMRYARYHPDYLRDAVGALDKQNTLNNDINGPCVVPASEKEEKRKLAEVVNITTLVS